MNKIFTVILVTAIPVTLYLLLVGESGFSFSTLFNSERPLMEINDTPINVYIFDEQEERVKGLSGRPSLPSNTGALFIFEESDYHGIWMRDMLISIDIIWIDENFEIVHIERNVHPSTFPTVFEPDVPARFVIETTSRYTNSFDIEVGDRVTLPRGYVPEDLRE